MLAFLKAAWSLLTAPAAGPIASAIAVALAIGLFNTSGQLSTANAELAALHKAEAEAARVAARTTAKTAQAAQDVGQRVAERQEQVRVEYRTITERVPVYVTEKADRQCVVPSGFVRLHDAAAEGRAPPVPDGAGEPPDAPSGVPLSAVADTIVWNYGTCAEDRERLKGWQDWYAAMKAAWPTP